MVKNTNKKGFTIIEVVLVLAIAGLIFLMVFIALPALQRGQRNTQRKNDLSRFVTAATQYQANNSNKLPFSSSTSLSKDSQFVKRYIIANGDESQFQDPNGEDYRFYTSLMDLTKDLGSGEKVKSGASRGGVYYTFENNKNDIFVYTNAKCSAEEGYIEKSSGKNDFALVMILEGNSFACNDNQ